MISYSWKSIPIGLLTSASLALLPNNSIYSKPTGFSLQKGKAVPVQTPEGLLIEAGKSALIHWEDFSIAREEILRITHAGGSGCVVNRVLGATRSEILGQLLSNGSVYLINPNGILIGKDAFIDTAGFIGSTLDFLGEDLIEKTMRFQGESEASVVNEGTIHCRIGDVFLIGRKVENSGEIITENGRQGLLSGFDVLVKPNDAPKVQIRSEQLIDAKTFAENPYALAIRHSGKSRTGDKQAVYFSAADGLTEVFGEVTSPGGTVHVLGDVVRVDDQAVIDVSHDAGGGTILVGGDYQGKNPEVLNALVTYFGKEATLKGDALQHGDGGRVILWADEALRAYGQVSVRGGEFGGDGGLVETSSHGFISIAGLFADRRAPLGKAGTLLLDPCNVSISNAATTNEGFAANTYTPTGTSPANILNTELQTNLAAGNVTVLTTGACGGGELGSITIANNVTWSANTTLTLTADSNIVINAGVTVQSNYAGGSPVAAMVFTAAGTSSTSIGILFNATSSLIASAGSISLTGTGGSGSSSGINIFGNESTIQTGDGNIVLQGTGGTGGSARGVIISGASSTQTLQIVSTGAGNITFQNCTGGDGGSFNQGVYIGGYANIQTNTGIITFATCTAGNNSGVCQGIRIAGDFVNGPSTITSNNSVIFNNIQSGTGGTDASGMGIGLDITIAAPTITLTGIKGNTPASGNSVGFSISQGILSASTSLSITATSISTVAASTNYGIQINPISTLNFTTTTGTLSLNGSYTGNASGTSVGTFIGGGTISSSSGGNVVLSGSSNSTGGSSHGLSVTGALASITSGTLTFQNCASGIGSASHAVSLTAAVTTAGNAVFATCNAGAGAGNIGVLTGALTVGNNLSFTNCTGGTGSSSKGVSVSNTTTVGGNATFATCTAIGGIVDFMDGVIIAGSTTITGNLIATINIQGEGSGTCYGWDNTDNLSAANITITGTGVCVAAGANGTGIEVTGTSKTLQASSTNGSVTLVGFGGVGFASAGVRVDTSAKVQSIDGPISITGSTTGGTTSLHGVQFQSTVSPVTSTHGSITISGIASASGIDSYGVSIETAWTTGTDGTLTFQNCSGSTGTAYGVSVAGTLTTSGNAVFSTCTAGTGANSFGVNVSRPVSITGSATLISCTAGAGSSNAGVNFTSAGATTITGNLAATNNITSTGSSGSNFGWISNAAITVGGNVNITATAPSGGAGSIGVYLPSGGNLSATNTNSAITINGTSPTGGIFIQSAAVTSVNGSTTLTGTASGAGATNVIGVEISTGSVGTAAGTLSINGNVTGGSGSSPGILISAVNAIASSGGGAVIFQGTSSATGVSSHGVSITGAQASITSGSLFFQNCSGGSGSGSYGINITGAVTTAGNALFSTCTATGTSGGGVNIGATLTVGGNLIATTNITGGSGAANIGWTHAGTATVTGSINITATATGSGAAIGISISSSMSATGASSNITLAGSSTSSQGVSITNGTVSSVNGTIQLTGTSAGGLNNRGVSITSNNPIQSTGGNIILSGTNTNAGTGGADALFIQNATWSVLTTGTVSLINSSSNALSTAVVFISNPFTTLGGMEFHSISGGNGVLIQGTYTIAGNLLADTITGSAGTTSGGWSATASTGTMTVGGSVRIEAVGTLGTPALRFAAGRLISSSVGGSITLLGTSTFVGVNIVAGTISCTGAGGSISITGVSSGTSVTPRGVAGAAGALVTTTGTITIIGSVTGGANAGNGILIAGANFLSSSSGGNIILQGSSASSVANSHGISITGSQTVITTGTVTFQNSSGGTGSPSHGVNLAATFSTNGAVVFGTCTGGSGAAYGVNITRPFSATNNVTFATITTTSATASGGAVLIGSLTTIGGNLIATTNITTGIGAGNIGWTQTATTNISGSGSQIQISASSLAASGTGYGISLTAGAMQTSSASGGSITLLGTGTIRGMNIAGATITTTANSGTVTLTGTGDGASADRGLSMGNSGFVVSGSGPIIMVGNVVNSSAGSAGLRLEGNTTNPITSTSGSITITGSTSAGADFSHGFDLAGSVGTWSTGATTATITFINCLSGTGNSCVGANFAANFTTLGNASFTVCTARGAGGNAITIANGSTSTVGGNLAATNSISTSASSGNNGWRQEGIVTVTGTVDITASSLSSSGNAHGIYISRQLSAAGTSTITLQGTGGASSSASHGIFIENVGKIVSSSGPILLSGTASGSGPNQGIQLTGTTSPITSTSGPITLSGTTSASGSGVNLGTTVTWATGSSGLLSFVNCQGGSSNGVNLGATVTTNGSASFSVCTAGTSSGACGVSIAAPFSATNNVTFATITTQASTTNGAGVNILGTLTVGGNLLATTNITTGAGSGNTGWAGNANTTVTGSINIQASSGSTTGAGHGISLTAGAMSTTAGGTITLAGTGGTSTGASYGVNITGGTNTITTSTGNGPIIISGSASGTTVAHLGVNIASSQAGVITSTTGSISITGTSTAAVAASHGVLVANPWSTGTTGTVTFTGAATQAIPSAFPIVMAATFTTGGVLNYNNAVGIGTSIASTNTITSSGTMTFSSTIDGVGVGINTLTLTPGAAPVILNGNVGATQRLASFTITAGSSVLSVGTGVTSIQANSFTVAGTVPTTLNNTGTLTIDTSVFSTGSISFGGTINGASAGVQSLTLAANTTGTITLVGNIGNTTALGNLNINSGSIAQFASSATAVVNVSSLVVNAAVTNTTFGTTTVTTYTVNANGASGISFGGDLNANTDSPSPVTTLNLNATNSITFGGNVGNTHRFLALNINQASTVYFGSGTHTINMNSFLIDNAIPVVLQGAGNTTINTNFSGATGSITFTGGINGDTAGQHGLTLNAISTGTILLEANIGTTTVIGPLAVTLGQTATFGSGVSSVKAASVSTVSSVNTIFTSALTTVDTSANNGNISFDGAVDGAVASTNSLTLIAGTGAVSFGTNVGTTRLGALTVTSASGVAFGSSVASVQATSLSIASGVPMTIARVGTTSIDTTGALGQSYGGTINATGAGRDLTLTAGATGPITFFGSIGTVGTPLGVFLVSTASTARFQSTVTNVYASSFTISAGPPAIPTLFSGTGTTTIDTSAAGGNITFGGTIDGETTAGGHNVTLTAGAGSVLFGNTVSSSIIGGTVPLGALSVTSATLVSFLSQTSAITANSLAIASGIPTTIAFVGTTAITTSGVAGVSFGGTLNGVGSNTQALTITTNGGGSTTFSTDVGTTNPLGAVNIASGSTSVIFGSGTHTVNASSLTIASGTAAIFQGTGLTTINTNYGGGGVITFGGTIDGETTPGGHSFVLTAGAGGAVTFGNDIGNSVRLGDISVNSALSVSVLAAVSAIKSNSLTIASAIPTTLVGTGTTTITTTPTSSTGNVLFGGTLGSSTVGGHNLTITAGTGNVTFNGNIGGALGATRLGALSVTSATLTSFTSGASPFTVFANSVSISSPAQIAETLTTITTTPTSGTGNISFGSTLDGTALGKSLTLVAGLGGGNITFTGAVGATNRLNALTITSATNVTASSSISAVTLTQTNGSGISTFNGAIDTTSTTSLTGVQFAMNSTVNASSITFVNSGLLAIAAAGDMTTTSGNFDQSGGGAIQTAGNISSAADIHFTNAITLTGNVNMTAADDIFYDSTIDGTFALTVSGNNITYTGAVGSGTPLLSISSTSSPGVINVYANHVVSAGPMTYDGDVVLHNAITFTDSGAGAVSFITNTASNGDAISGPYDTTITAISTSVTISGDVNLAGTVGLTSGGDFTVTAGTGFTIDGDILTFGYSGGGAGGAVQITSSNGSISVDNISSYRQDMGLGGNIYLAPSPDYSGGYPVGLIILNGNLIASNPMEAISGFDGEIFLDSNRSSQSTVATIVSSPYPPGNDVSMRAKSITMGMYEAMTVLGNLTMEATTLTLSDIVVLEDLSLTSSGSTFLNVRSDVTILDYLGNFYISPTLHFLAGGTYSQSGALVPPDGALNAGTLGLSPAAFSPLLVFDSHILNYDSDAEPVPTPVVPTIPVNTITNLVYEVGVANSQLSDHSPTYSRDFPPPYYLRKQMPYVPSHPRNLSDFEQSKTLKPLSQTGGLWPLYTDCWIFEEEEQVRDEEICLQP